MLRNFRLLPKEDLLFLGVFFFYDIIPLKCLGVPFNSDQVQLSGSQVCLQLKNIPGCTLCSEHDGSMELHKARQK